MSATWEIRQGDCVELMAEIPDGSIDAVVCDPPYGIGFMGHDWDQPGEHRPWPRRVARSRSRRASAGAGGPPHPAMQAGLYDLNPTANRRFQAWCETWAAEALRVLKPGGHMLVCGGTRTYHRMAAGVEDAGFEIRDCLAWQFGSGFPKSLNLDGEWQGWGTALKPGWESVTVAQKPIEIAEERHTIDKNLCELHAKLRSLADVSSVGMSSSSRLAGHDADTLDSAQWTAAERDSTWAALCAQTDTSRCESAIATSLSIVSSWRATLDDLCEATSMSTTATVSSTTTALRTLKSCLSDLTPRTIIEAAIHPGGPMWNALPAAVAFSAVASSLSAIHTLSALASATASAPIARRDEAEPPLEPVVLARKPLAGTVRANAEQHGTGALNIDGCRIEGDVPSTTQGQSARQGEVYGADQRDQREFVPASGGRWPANVAMDPQAAAMLDAQTGELASNSGEPFHRNTDKHRHTYGAFKGTREEQGYYGDKGGASRFFYVAKASRSERNAGLDAFDAKPLNWSNGDQAPGTFQGEGTDRTAKNAHPTVKPIELMRWLVRLVAPPGGTVLDPFNGSGTTGCAALLEGMDYIGLEREAEYVAIAQARLAYWADPIKAEAALEVHRAETERRDRDEAAGALSLFGDEEAA